jgi:hypothetical protein
VLVGVAILGRFDWRTLRLGRGEWETLLCSAFFMGQILWLGEGVRGKPARVGHAGHVRRAGGRLRDGGGRRRPTPAGAGRGLGFPVWVVLTLVLTLVCTVGAFSIMTKWQPRITATEAGLIYCVEPVFASVFALFLPALISPGPRSRLSERAATWSLLIGGGLITIANVLVQTRPAAPTSTLL